MPRSTNSLSYCPSEPQSRAYRSASSLTRRCSTVALQARGRLASRPNVSDAPPSVSILVDQAVENAASGSSSAETYDQFARALADAVSGSAIPVAGSSAFAPLREEVAPENRRLVAWALLRYLGNHGSFPSEPRELRPRALQYIRQQLSHDLKVHRIDFSLQSHELEDVLSQVVPSIEREVSEATSFRGLDTLEHYEESLFSAINSRRNASLLYAFANRSLVNNALKISLQAAKDFVDASELEVLEQYDQALTACMEAQADLEESGTTYAMRYFSIVPAALRKEVEREASGLSLADPASLSLEPLSKKYPLHIDENEIDIRLVLHNLGDGTAFDVQVEIEGTHDLKLERSELSIGTLAPRSSRTLHFPARVLQSQPLALLGASVHWMNFDRRPSSFNTDLELEGQDPNIDWMSLAKSRPYSLDVAIGDRFVGRASDLDRLRGYVNSPNPGSLYLWGHKRVGKTSLIRALADSLHASDDDFAVVYLETIRELTPAETTDAMCRRLVARLRAADPRFADVAEPTYTGTLSPLNDFLDRLHVLAPDKRLIIILDEFDELPTELYKGRGVADTFFQTLGKGIANKAGVGVLLVGGERIQAIVRAQGMRLNMYRPFYIDHFERTEEFTALVRLPGSPFEFNSDAIDVLWDYSAGNPYFLNEICSRLAELMTERRDAHVTAQEVADAILATLQSIDSNSFAHYWADGIVAVDAEEEATLYTDRIRLLVAVAEVLQLGGGSIPKDTLAERASQHGCTSSAFERLLREFQRRDILIEDNDSYRIRVRLFQEWLRGRGYFDLRTLLLDDFRNSERVEDQSSVLVSDDEIHDMIDGWPAYQGARIQAIQVRRWLNQFGTHEDQRLMFTILQNLDFYAEDRIREKFSQVNQAIVANLGSAVRSGREHRRDIVVSHLGPVGRSGPPMARLYRQVNRIWHENCVGASDIGKVLEENGQIKAVVFVDDFVGTGSAAEGHFKELFEKQKELIRVIQERNVHVWYAVAVGTEPGLNALRRAMEKGPIEVRVLAGDELGPEHRAFDGDANIWLNDADRKLAEEIARSWGERLDARGPLGFRNTQGLVVFEHNCPNTSLPILYRNRKALQKAFLPLFPRSS